MATKLIERIFDHVFLGDEIQSSPRSGVLYSCVWSRLDGQRPVVNLITVVIASRYSHFNVEILYELDRNF